MLKLPHRSWLQSRGTVTITAVRDRKHIRMKTATFARAASLLTLAKEDGRLPNQYPTPISKNHESKES